MNLMIFLLCSKQLGFPLAHQRLQDMLITRTEAKLECQITKAVIKQIPM